MTEVRIQKFILKINPVTEFAISSEECEKIAELFKINLRDLSDNELLKFLVKISVLKNNLSRQIIKVTSHKIGKLNKYDFVKVLKRVPLHWDYYKDPLSDYYWERCQEIETIEKKIDLLAALLVEEMGHGV